MVMEFLRLLKNVRGLYDHVEYLIEKDIKIIYFYN